MAEETKPDAIEVGNKFGVASGGDEVVFLFPIPRRISQQDALLLAAYIVAMNADNEQWTRTLRAVCGT